MYQLPVFVKLPTAILKKDCNLNEYVNKGTKKNTILVSQSVDRSIHQMYQLLFFKYSLGDTSPKGGFYQQQVKLGLLVRHSVDRLVGPSARRRFSPSVRLSVRPSARPFISLSVRPSVH